MVELHKALEENSTCRSPLLEGHQSHEEVRDRDEASTQQLPARVLARVPARRQGVAAR
jgi:hypothetical protein